MWRVGVRRCSTGDGIAGRLRTGRAWRLDVVDSETAAVSTELSLAGDVTRRP
jgi:hypothetical protein